MARFDERPHTPATPKNELLLAHMCACRYVYTCAILVRRRGASVAPARSCRGQRQLRPLVCQCRVSERRTFCVRVVGRLEHALVAGDAIALLGALGRELLPGRLLRSLLRVFCVLALDLLFLARPFALTLALALLMRHGARRRPLGRVARPCRPRRCILLRDMRLLRPEVCRCDDLGRLELEKDDRVHGAFRGARHRRHLGRVPVPVRLWSVSMCPCARAAQRPTW